MQLKVLNDIEAIGQEHIIHEKNRVNENAFRGIIPFIIYVDDQALNFFATQVIDNV